MEGIYEKYGGERFWELIIDLFYEKNMTDNGLRGFFEGKDINKIKAMNRHLLSVALRSSDDHFSVSVKRVHRGFGIRVEHFEKFVNNFKTVLQENKVTEDDSEYILMVVESFREDVLV
jgi:hemoglobin